MAAAKSFKKPLDTLRRQALAYPETIEDFPWGHSAFKVKGKIFLSAYLDDKSGTLSLSMKLPVSGTLALTLPFAAPTQYGLGPHGWVTCKFDAGDEVPTDMLLEWLDESFRAVAPKRIVAALEDNASPPTKPKRKKKQ